MDRKEREYGKMIFLADIINSENSGKGYSHVTVAKLADWSGLSKDEISDFISILRSLNVSVIIDDINIEYYSKIRELEEQEYIIGYTMGYTESAIINLFRYNGYGGPKSHVPYDLISEVPAKVSKNLFRMFFNKCMELLFQAIDDASLETGYPVDVILQMAQFPPMKKKRYKSFKKRMLSCINNSPTTF